MQYRYQAPFGTLLCRLHNGLPAEILLQQSAAPFLPALPNPAGTMAGQLFFR